MKRNTWWTKDILGRKDRRLRDFLFSDLDFLRKVKDRTICKEKVFREKNKRIGESLE